MAKILSFLVISGADLTHFRKRLFDLFRSFFATFPSDSASHPHVIAALNHVLCELAPNDVRGVGFEQSDFADRTP
jgi:hypothetical protein